MQTVWIKEEKTAETVRTANTYTSVYGAYSLHNENSTNN